MRNKTFLPYGQHCLEADDINAVVETMKSDLLTGGLAVEKFEKTVKEIVRAPFCVSCSSGTAGLHLSAKALGLGKGDTVIVPSITFLATANTMRVSGAEILFADVEPETGLMGPDQLEECLNRHDKKVSAAIVVHLGGQIKAPEVFASMAKKHNFKIIEDACHAMGTTYKTPDHAGIVGDCKFSQACVFSFHPVKAVAMGEGGCVTTNLAEADELLKAYRNNGMIKNPKRFKNTKLAFDSASEVNQWYYEMHSIGLNYRASDIHCSLGSSQLAKLPKFIEKRRRLVSLYDKFFEELDNPWVKPVKREPNCEPGWHIYQLLIDFDKLGITRNKVMSVLYEIGIGTQVHYVPVHLQPYYENRYGNSKLPGAMEFYMPLLCRQK